MGSDTPWGWVLSARPTGRFLRADAIFDDTSVKIMSLFLRKLLYDRLQILTLGFLK